MQPLVKRSRNDRFFVGWALSEYENAHAMSDERLAAWLDCTPSNLQRLFLCRLPIDDEERFQENVARIAGYVSCNADRLVQLLREVAAVAALREKNDTDTVALLMAARDRKKRDEEDTTN
jgi:hypothetical protein